MHVPYQQLGANVPCLDDCFSIAVVTHAFYLLLCPDVLVSSIATSTLRDTAPRKIAKQLTNRDLATFLRGLLEGDFV